MKKIFLMMILLIFVSSSCQRLANIIGIDFEDGLTYPDSSMPIRNFKAAVFDYYGNPVSRTYKFYKIREYSKLIIYAEQRSGYKPENVDYIAKVFNDNYDEEVRIYGAHTDVDRNGKIIILLLNLNSNYNGPITSGYFYGADLILGQNNDAEILYMDMKSLNNDPRYMAGTIQHEFQHLINFNVNYIQKKRAMSAWLNESLSESTSLLFSRYTVQSRVNEFNTSANGYYCFYTWDLPLNIFANYPSASVFMNWLYEKNGRNANVFQNIAKSSQNDDYQKVLSSVGYIGASGWDDLLLKWIEGVKNKEVAGAELKIQNAGSKVPLYPGAAVAYIGNIPPSGNLVTRNFGNGIQVALNKDMNDGKNPKAIDVTIPNNSISLQASKMYNSAVGDKPYTPKYRHVLFDENGKIKKY